MKAFCGMSGCKDIVMLIYVIMKLENNNFHEKL